MLEIHGFALFLGKLYLKYDRPMDIQIDWNKNSTRILQVTWSSLIDIYVSPQASDIEGEMLSFSASLISEIFSGWMYISLILSTKQPLE